MQNKKETSLGKIIKLSHCNIRNGRCVPSVAPAIGFQLFANDCGQGQLYANTTSKQNSGETGITGRGDAVAPVDANDLPLLDIVANGTVNGANLQLPTPYYSSKNGPQFAGNVAGVCLHSACFAARSNLIRYAFGKCT